MRSTVGCGVVRFLILAGWVIAGPIVHAQLRTQTRSDEAPTNDPLPDDLGEFLRKFPFLDFGADEDFSVIARMTKGEFEFRPTAETWQVVRPPLGPSGCGVFSEPEPGVEIVIQGKCGVDVMEDVALMFGCEWPFRSVVRADRVQLEDKRWLFRTVSVVPIGTSPRIEERRYYFDESSTGRRKGMEMRFGIWYRDSAQQSGVRELFQREYGKFIAVCEEGKRLCLDGGEVEQ